MESTVSTVVVLMEVLSTEVVLISIDGSMEVFEKKKEERGRKREKKKERVREDGVSEGQIW